MKFTRVLVAAAALAAVPEVAPAAPPGYDDKTPQKYDLTKRASEIDPRAKEHPEIDFLFADKAGKVRDLQHAAVDTRARPQGKLVVWLMDHNQALFDRVSGYGLHAVQIHYANRWFGGLKPEVRDDGTSLGKIRLEAATGEDHSPAVDIPKPDGIAERTFQFVRWLSKNHPQGKWEQFLTDDGREIRWESVILSGISHGSTTAARFAVHRKVDRVVMFSGPRDQTESWQGLPSATPSERFFGFSHVLDGGWTGHHYCRSWEMLGLNKHGPIVNVEDSKPPFGNTRRLTSTCDVKKDANRAHTVVVPGGGAAKGPDGKFIHEDVWKFLFLHPVGVTGEATPKDPACKVAAPKK